MLITLRISEDLLGRLDASLSGRGRSEVIREAVERHLNAQTGLATYIAMTEASINPAGRPPCPSCGALNGLHQRGCPTA